MARNAQGDPNCSRARSAAIAVLLGALLLALAAPAPGGAGKPASGGAAKRGTGKPGARPNLVGDAARIQRSARRRWPGSFAGLWIRRGRIFVAFTRRASNRVKELRRQIPKGGRLRKVVFDDSLRQLETLLDIAGADRATGSRPISAPYDLSIDQQRNEMVVTVERIDLRVLQNFRSRYGADVIVEQGPVSDDFACSIASCFPTLRAGLTSLIPQPDALHVCTTGFVVFHRGSAKNLILSSAHCGGLDAGNPGGVRRHGAPANDYGFAWKEVYAGGVDAEIQRVYAAFNSRKPYIYVNKSAPTGLVHSYGARGNVVEGMQLCKSGHKTGRSCGPVTDLHFQPSNIPSVPGQYMIRTKICAQPGDSGAPVYRDLKLRKPLGAVAYQAQGLLSGGPAKSGVALPCSDPAFYSYFSHIESIHKALPVRVLRLRDLKK